MTESKKSFDKFSLWFFTDFRRNNAILYWFSIFLLLIIIMFTGVGIVFLVSLIVSWINGKIRPTPDPTITPTGNPEIYHTIGNRVSDIFKSLIASSARP